MKTKTKYYWRISNASTSEVLEKSSPYKSYEKATKAARRYASQNIDPGTRITITIFDEHQQKTQEIEDVIPTSIKGRASIWLTFVGCLVALSIVWINDLLSACRSSKLALFGLSGFEGIGMVITVLFFISVLSLFPALIYLAFELEGRERAKKRTLKQLEREHLIDLKEQVDTSFDAAYDPSKYPLPVVLVTVAMMLGWAFFFFRMVRIRYGSWRRNATYPIF